MFVSRQTISFYQVILQLQWRTNHLASTKASHSIVYASQLSRAPFSLESYSTANAMLLLLSALW